MRHSHWVLPVLTLFLIGCATTDADKQRGSRAQLNQITAEEIAAINLSSAFDVVQSLRPNWLRERGPVSLRNPQANQVVIYVDGTRLGGMEFLRQIRAGTIASMEYLSGPEATFRFGINHVGGAILVRTPSG